MNAVLAAGAKRRFLSVADLNLPDTDRSGGADPVLAATLEPGSQPLVDAAETRPAGRPAAVATDPVVTPVGVSGVARRLDTCRRGRADLDADSPD